MIFVKVLFINFFSFFLLFSFSFAFSGDICQSIISRFLYPVPAVADNKEALDFQKRNIDIVDRVSKYLEDYITTRRELENKSQYINWQWQRVEAGIEYKKDIWKEDIGVKKLSAKLRAIILRLQSLGVSQKELDACYRSL